MADAFSTACTEKAILFPACAGYFGNSHKNRYLVILRGRVSKPDKKSGTYHLARSAFMCLLHESNGERAGGPRSIVEVVFGAVDSSAGQHNSAAVVKKR